MEENLSLYQLNNLIRNTLKENFPFTYWVTAEISDFRESQQGHCYLELLEKDEERIIAKAKANIWANNYLKIQSIFYNTTGTHLSNGIKVLLNVSIELHEIYGYSLNIYSIDPSYTIGELAKKKQEIINQLEEDGIIDMNKEIELPIVIQNIAIISAPTAAGFEDFKDQLHNNIYNFKFNTYFFPSIMQGDGAPNSIIKALENIYEEEKKYDAVIIIRGGGAKSELSCFDDYELASNLAQFPIPIITGIGHERDDTIADIVANKKLKTPTAVAEYIINTALQFDSSLDNYKDYITDYYSEIIYNEDEYLKTCLHSLKDKTQKTLIKEESIINECKFHLNNSSKNYIKNQDDFLNGKIIESKNKILQTTENKKTKLNSFADILSLKSKLFINNCMHQLNINEITIEKTNPINILKKGYSITIKDGKKITKESELSKGDVIETRLFYGKVKSIIK